LQCPTTDARARSKRSLVNVAMQAQIPQMLTKERF